MKEGSIAANVASNQVIRVVFVSEAIPRASRSLSASAGTVMLFSLAAILFFVGETGNLGDGSEYQAILCGAAGFSSLSLHHAILGVHLYPCHSHGVFLPIDE